MNPGIYTDLSNEDYHAADGISKSGLDLIDRSPLHYRFRKDNPGLKEETPSMQRGSLIHTLALEPDQFGETYAVMPASIKQRRGKDYEAFLQEAGPRSVITANQHQEASLIVQALLENPAATKILEDAASRGSIEVSVFAEDFETGALCKCRPDLITEGGHKYDLKSTQNADGRSFSYSARNFRYHVQAAFYTDVCAWAGIDPGPFGFVAVDTGERPYQCVVYHDLAPGDMERGRALYRENLNTYVRCLESGEWPGYPSEYDFLTTSGYAFDLEDLTGDSDASN